jgi:outer membrane protein OmpA-like peptidoglycan-associated protein
MMGRLLLGFAVMLLCSCAPVADREEAAPAPSFSVDELAARAQTLPGAQVEKNGGLQIRYPGETLFAAGSILPLARGEELLAPLADFLKASEDRPWQVRVHAATALGEAYDQRLADKRLELLRRYLQRRGVAADGFDWQSSAGRKAPLILSLPAASP